ncbi:MAG: 4Fe-4S dicluster domain-containing protein [Dehalococcoidia bacterium]|nr:MAG: 4Fe-4S dicluster domain-containing protein [Dehalococcoidia bacterium]
MQLSFYINQSRCTGCNTCVVACKDWHDVSAGPVSWIRIEAIEKGKYPNPFLAYLPYSCYHCAKPACIPACPSGAIYKRIQDGIVVVNRELCLGKDNCQMCLGACPYDAPQFGAEDNARMQKCDLCLEKWQEGKNPICVDSCPTRALDVSSMDELRAKYGEIKEAAGFTYNENLSPSVIFKPKLPN